jgi:hypothetical protein
MSRMGEMMTNPRSVAARSKILLLKGITGGNIIGKILPELSII